MNPLTFELKDFIVAGTQIVSVLLAALILYYRLKAQTDANTTAITAILHEMGDNGFVKRSSLEDAFRVTNEITKRQDETAAQIKEEVERMRDTIDSIQATLRRRAIE